MQIPPSTSSVASAASYRWAGAGMALASALGIGAFIFLFHTLFPPIRLLVLLTTFFLGFTAPCLQLGPWAAGIGGRRFLARLIGGWIVAIAIFTGIIFIFSKTGLPRPEYDKYIGWYQFALLGPPGGIAMAIWAACLGRRKLTLPFFVAGLFYPFGIFFGLHWESALYLPHPHIIERVLVAAGMVLPMILLSPWIGASLPPTVVESPLLSKRGVTVIMSVIGCLLLGLGYLYHHQKPSALTIRQKPLRLHMSAGQNSATSNPAEILWQIESPRPWQFKEHIATNHPGGIIAFTGRQISVIQPLLDSYTEITGRLAGIGAGAVSSTGRLYFTSNGYVFSWEEGTEKWRWGSRNHFLDLLAHPDESVTAIAESQLVHLDKNGRSLWLYPEQPRSFQFVRAFTDGSTIFVLNRDAEVLAIDRAGKLLWHKEPIAAGDHYGGGYYLNPDSAGLITIPASLLIIGTTNSMIAFNASGQPQFYSKEPFPVFGCDERHCYSVVNRNSIWRIDFKGDRQLIYRSSETLLDCLVQASEQAIYALTKTKVTCLRTDGQFAGEMALATDLERLLAVHADHLYGRTSNALVTVQSRFRAP